MTSRINSSEDLGRRVARRILNQFFTTQDYPYTRHHLDSYDQFLSRDLISIFQSQNPVRLVKERIRDTSKYAYNIEVYVGGLDGTKVEIGTPVVNLDAADDVRMLFPNEARLRNLTYAAQVKVDILVRVIFTDPSATGPNPEPYETKEKIFEGVNLFKIPIMLHSRFCHLHGKPKEFLIQAGECPFDNGGYFIVDGAEKILIGRQEQAFNTLYVSKQDSDEKISTYANVISLSPKSRRLTFTAFAIYRSNGVIYATLPMVRAPVNIFVLFRALGIQSDEAIVRMIFPDLTSADSQLLADKLIPTIINAYPFLTTTLAIEYIKSLTKGFSVATVLDILKNKLFTHVDDTPGARATYLAECIRSILKVEHGFEKSTSRDDTRNQRCLTSGFLVQDQFTGAYDAWMKAVRFEIDKYYNYNKTIYSGLAFMNIFVDGNRVNIFKEGMITDQLNVGFKGKWGSGLGEEKTGVLQALSRLSYLDFMSHCRRVVLNFDTGMKLTGPRMLHGSQYGFFCTNETPSGASIGITKNLTVLATISTGMQNTKFVNWLYERGGVVQCASVTADEKAFYVPVSLNNGIIGFTADPLTLLKVLKAMKHTGFLPTFSSIAFSYSQRRLLIFTDEGRPLRPLIVLSEGGKYPIEKIATAKTWKELLVGTHPRQLNESLTFVDPLEGREGKPTAEDYLKDLEPYKGCIEYIDPYEQNEILIANYPEHIIAKETTHVEIHPSTILSILTTMIPYANHNQSPRNQLSDSQSKQSISIYATNWKNRYDSSGHIACYGDAPISRTLYYDYLAEGRIPYGNNVILAIAMHGGYNQDDGFVINKTSLERGLFRTVTYRSYEFYEEDDEATGLKKRIGNPAKIGEWLDIRPGLDYLKLDERGIVKIGEYVDEDTVLVGGYYQMEKGKYKDASITAKVWTRGIVEDVVVTVNNKGLRLVKVRVVQDRVPELGDKFCLTPDHDVLTQTGWKSIAQVDENDFVCTLNENGDIEYSKPTGFYSFNCNDESLYHIKSQQIELVTTFNHKMYVKPRGRTSYSLIPAKDIRGKRVQYKKHGRNTNAEYNIQLNGVKLFENTDAFLEFLGYWISDGWVYTRKDGELRIELSLGRKEDMIHVADLIKQMGYNSYSNTDFNKLFISSKTLGTYLKTFSNGAANKVLPVWVWKLSERQCRVLLAGLIGGDGTVTNSGTEKYYTTSVVLADQFQRLCLHAGWSGNKKKLAEAGTQTTIKGRLTQLNADYWSISIVKSKNEPMVNHGHSKSQNGQSENTVKYTGGVYCIEVPSHVFYVRYNGKCVWTGNSNRHGQKGTIGAILPATDLPSNRDGIVPDIIANPHAIPSRMTMAMLLETLLGKTAALHGAIGDATPFMNEGNPADEIGAVLEGQYGFERYSNEVLYDGISGKQMDVAIFIGPAYYMRLKHMVEDKWQARTNGRKEAKTHQPTGGRGNEGGIRFGELERDSVLCHGTMGFLQDTIMHRSDGAKFPICTGCGTIPIYNQKQGISICPTCQGPVKFAGNSADNLELIPPIKKQIAPIVEVEMPYCMKLLDQEMITFGNMPMRFLTTAGVDKLNGPNVIVGGEPTAIVQLPELKLPEVQVPEIETVAITNTEAMKAVLPKLEELADLAKKVGMTLVPETSAMARAIASPEIALGNEVVPGSTETGEKVVEGSIAAEEEPEVQVLPGALPTSTELKVLGSKAPITTPRVVAPAPAITSEQMANFIVNTAINQPQLLQAAATQAQAAAAVPSGPTVIVDTSPSALAADGLMAPTLRVAARRPRSEPRPKTSTAPAPAPAQAHGPIVVNKLG